MNYQEVTPANATDVNISVVDAASETFGSTAAKDWIVVLQQP